MKAGPLISTSHDPNTPEQKTQDPDMQGQDPTGAAPLPPVFPGIALRPEPLSRGPLAVVYRGWDRTHRCQVAVKVQRNTDDPVAASRFGREAAVMLRLRHPSIVSLYAAYDPDPATGRPAALVLEYVSGPTLASLVAEGGHLPLERAVRIIEEIAAALDCVHGAGIIHRDVKPSNILLPQHGSARLSDFGVARILDSARVPEAARLDDDVPLTVMGDVLGTIEYASPEQVHGKGQVDARSDVYSLAAVSYFALTGTPPFRAADSSTQAQLSVMHRQVFSAPPPLRLHRADLPAGVEDAVLRGLAKAPESRYDSAGQLAAALRSAVLSASAAPQTVAADESARRTGALAGALASAVLLLAGFGVWTMTRHAHSPAEAVRPALPAPRTASSVPIVQAHPTASSVPVVKPPQTAGSPAPKPAAPPKPAIIKPPAIAKVPAAKPPVRVARTAQAARPHSSHAPAHAARPATVPVPHKTARLVPRRVIAAQAPKKHLPTLAPVAQIAPVLSAAAAPALVPPILTAAAVVPTAWYAVSGWAAIPDDVAAGKTQLVRAAALWIKVDNQPFAALALGQWAALPAGKHLVTFQPAKGMGVGPKTWAIDLAPAARLSQQIPLPPAPLPPIPPHLRNP